MDENRLLYYPYASFTNEQLPLLNVAALYFDKLVILDPVGASWAAVGADHSARDAVTLVKDAGILEGVMPAAVLAKYAGPLTEAVRRDWPIGSRTLRRLGQSDRQAAMDLLARKGSRGATKP